MESREGKSPASCFSSRQAGLCPISENDEKDLAKRVESTYQMDGSLQARLTLAKASRQQAGLEGSNKV